MTLPLVLEWAAFLLIQYRQDFQMEFWLTANGIRVRVIFNNEDHTMTLFYEE